MFTRIGHAGRLRPGDAGMCGTLALVVSDQDAHRFGAPPMMRFSRLGLNLARLFEPVGGCGGPLPLERVANAMAAAGRTTGPLGIASGPLFRQPRRLTAAYATALPRFAGGRFVGGPRSQPPSRCRASPMPRSSCAARSLRLPFIGLIRRRGGRVIHWFARIGWQRSGFGNALSLLGDLASEVWAAHLQLGAVCHGPFRSWASWAGIQGRHADGAAKRPRPRSSVFLGKRRADTRFRGAFDAIQVRFWGVRLPARSADFAFSGRANCADRGTVRGRC